MAGLFYDFDFHYHIYQRSGNPFGPRGTAPIGKEKEQDKNRPCLPTIPEIVSL
jgi:hypothetical protein